MCFRNGNTRKPPESTASKQKPYWQRAHLLISFGLEKDPHNRGMIINFDPSYRFQPEKRKRNGRWFIFFYSDLTSLSTIFQPYFDGVWMWQGTQCSLLECCLTEIPRPRHMTLYSTQSHKNIHIQKHCFLILSIQQN